MSTRIADFSDAVDEVLADTEDNVEAFDALSAMLQIIATRLSDVDTYAMPNSVRSAVRVVRDDVATAADRMRCAGINLRRVYVDESKAVKS